MRPSDGSVSPAAAAPTPKIDVAQLTVHAWCIRKLTGSLDWSQKGPRQFSRHVSLRLIIRADAGALAGTKLAYLVSTYTRRFACDPNVLSAFAHIEKFGSQYISHFFLPWALVIRSAGYEDPLLARVRMAPKHQIQFTYLYSMGQSAAIFEALTANIRHNLPDHYSYTFLDGEKECHAGPGIASMFSGPYSSFHVKFFTTSIAEQHAYCKEVIEDEGSE